MVEKTYVLVFREDPRENDFTVCPHESIDVLDNSLAWLKEKTEVRDRAALWAAQALPGQVFFSEYFMIVCAEKEKTKWMT